MMLSAVSPACCFCPEIAPLSPDAHKHPGLSQHHKYNLSVSSEELLPPAVHLNNHSLLRYWRWIIEIRRLLTDVQEHRCFCCRCLGHFFPINVFCHAADGRIESGRVAVIVSFSGWQRLVIIQKCNNVNVTTDFERERTRR